MDDAFVDFVVARVELGEARGPADYQRQNAGRHRVERAEVAYFFSSSEPADLVDDVMRGPAGRLIDDNGSIHLVTVTGGFRVPSVFENVGAYNASMRTYMSILGTLLVCAAQETASFRTSVDLVPVTCAVTGRDGQPVLDMRAGDFVLLDNGKSRPVQYLWRDDDVPLTIGLVVDISGSQAPFIGEHRQTVIDFLSRVLRPHDQAFLVAVGVSVKLVTDLTHSIQDLKSGVARLDPQELFNPKDPSERTEFGEPCSAFPTVRLRPGLTRGLPSNWWCGTLLWNGLYSSVDQKTKSISGRKAVIVLTDGGDSGSTRDLNDVLEAAQSADTVVYTIHYAPSNTIRHRDPLLRLHQARLEKRTQAGLTRLAEETGGRALNDPKGDPSKIFEAIEKDLRNQYILAFTMPETSRDGRFHKLEVKSRRKGVTLRTRHGYLALR